MRIAVRRNRAEGDHGSPSTIALAPESPVAPLVRRPSILGLGPRRPPRRLSADGDVPAVSRIVLRPLNLR